MSLMVIALIAWYFKVWAIYGFCFGVLFTYLFVTERLFKKSMGRNPSDDEEAEMFKHIFKR